MILGIILGKYLRKLARSRLMLLGTILGIIHGNHPARSREMILGIILGTILSKQLRKLLVARSRLLLLGIILGTILGKRPAWPDLGK